MMKGTPCSGGNYARLKTSSKTRISIEVQGLGPWRGLGQRPNLALLHRSMVRAPSITAPRTTNPAKRVRAWAPSGLPAGGRIRACRKVLLGAGLLWDRLAGCCTVLSRGRSVCAAPASAAFKPALRLFREGTREYSEPRAPQPRQGSHPTERLSEGQGSLVRRDRRSTLGDEDLSETCPETCWRLATSRPSLRSSVFINTLQETITRLKST